VDALIAGIGELLPAVAGDADGPVSGTVFKIERGAAGEKVAYVRMFSGTVRTRETVQFGGTGSGPRTGRDAGEAKVTAIGVFERGSAARRRDAVATGEIGKLWGLGGIRVGAAIGVPQPALRSGTSPRRRWRRWSSPSAPPTVPPCTPPSPSSPSRTR
jgi:ribosomal protection tetracycline resistance protein